MSSDASLPPDTPLALTMIYNSQQRMEGKMDGVCNQVSDNRENIEKNSGRLFTHDEKFKAIDKHTDDPKVHWNKDLAEEGTAGYVARNKLKILIITTLTTIITLASGFVINWLQSLGA